MAFVPTTPMCWLRHSSMPSYCGMFCNFPIDVGTLEADGVTVKYMKALLVSYLHSISASSSSFPAHSAHTEVPSASPDRRKQLVSTVSSAIYPYTTPIMKLSTCYSAISLLASFSLPLADASPIVERATSRRTYINHAVNATGALSQWYSKSDGQWSKQWWQSANTITTLAGLAQIDPSYKSAATKIFETTFSAAKASNGGNWLNNFYDDEGW